MRLGNIRKLTRMKCDEEILHYLQYIKEVWQLIALDSQMSLIDYQTVQGMHMRAPSVSQADRDDLRSKLKDGVVFSAVPVDERELIYWKVLGISGLGLIPSFDSFFRDCNYLESISNCMKSLTLRPVQTTLRQTMDGHFIGSSPSFYKAYSSLAIFAMRFYDRMPKEPVLKDPLTLVIACPNKVVLREYARLAIELGFSNDRIIALSAIEIEANATYAVNFEVQDYKPPVSSAGPRIPEKRRSGRPYRRDYEDEQRLLKFDYLNDGSASIGREITPFLSVEPYTRTSSAKLVLFRAIWSQKI